MINTPETELILHEVKRYEDAEAALLAIEAVALQLEEEFAEDLEFITTIKEHMAERTAVLLTERGIEGNTAAHEAVQKDVRKQLFSPMTVVVDMQHPNVIGKTYKNETFAVTLVENKPKLERAAGLSEIEYYDAHKNDVQRFIDAGLHSLLAISTDDAAVGYVDAARKSGNPLKSVQLQRNGYCKVKLG